jgi:ABC-type multidrug transport system fused ATPase/permease subunit
VSEGGSNFSLGERQLVCLARSILRKSKILILDEATASIDIQTDRLVQDTIQNEFSNKKCTVIVVAHRLETLTNCNRIVLFKDGRIQEIGKPEKFIQNEK